MKNGWKKVQKIKRKDKKIHKKAEGDWRTRGRFRSSKMYKVFGGWPRKSSQGTVEWQKEKLMYQEVSKQKEVMRHEVASEITEPMQERIREKE